ncbi:MAG: hypothetical protein IJI58_02745 [Bacilli bacterium]|nr:hypothetical protein [Bacilli bacterium]
MKEFNQYMEQFKENSLKEKKEIALEQLKIITGLTNAMCIELGCANEMIITKDVLEGQKNKESEEDFVEAVVVYASSIQTSLCDLVDKITEILENKDNK